MAKYFFSGNYVGAGVKGLMDEGGSARREAAAKAMESLGRNPDASGLIQQNMILAIAFTEAIAIYALVVAIIIKFV